MYSLALYLQGINDQIIDRISKIFNSSQSGGIRPLQLGKIVGGGVNWTMAGKHCPESYYSRV